MTRYAFQNHMFTTRCSNPHGLDDKFNTSTAYDIAILCAKLLTPKQSKKQSGQKIDSLFSKIV